MEDLEERGRDRLHRWWGLTRASWLTIPRVLMQEMPDTWQRDMAKLLEEYGEAYPNLPGLGTRVQCTKDGKLVKTPSWAIQYRYPDRAAIAEAKKGGRERKE